MDAHILLFAALGLVTVVYLALWFRSARERGLVVPTPLETAVGFVTNFFDTLGIGSFAPTTASFKFFKLVPDQQIPGTLNVGHALPTVLEAFIFIAIVQVSPTTLIALIAAAVAGAYLGAGVVSRLPRRYIQIGMGLALTVAAILFVLMNLNLLPGGGSAFGVEGPLLLVGIAVNFCLGALMTLGIGLYAPCLILISLLGMNPLAAFPIMMGSCAFLMPVAGVRFTRLNRYELRAALGLTLGGLPAVLIAAFIVKSLDLTTVRWLVVGVVLIAAVTMLRSAYLERSQPAVAPA
ncbi:MAG: sulfite exporter TauE/SafE family protein [Vulcanimicrobiaceae bacterium]